MSGTAALLLLTVRVNRVGSAIDVAPIANVAVPFQTACPFVSGELLSNVMWSPTDVVVSPPRLGTVPFASPH